MHRARCSAKTAYWARRFAAAACWTLRFAAVYAEMVWLAQVFKLLCCQVTDATNFYKFLYTLNKIV